MLVIYFILVIIVLFIIFFFKQKTAYEMRISDWSSDVCSSDLAFLLNIIMLSVFVFYLTEVNEFVSILLYLVCPLMLINIGLYVFLHKIGRASCRERVCQYV